MKRILLLFSLILLSGICLFVLILKIENTRNICGTISPQPFCGTVGPKSEEASIGKAIFNTNCAACHKLDKRMTGPALRNIAQKYDSTTIKNYIIGNKKLIATKNYNSKCLNFPFLTEKEISNLISYTN
ncbi:cytochrome c [uncultured Lacinutrix sp.]|uniref:c-type cytochrome n=1 Tax=uncultured Lacinutrix sp. TaxID=574032 RepID=UPI002623089C|nr:cytochrome c [uncultured Lacinutrix sp.]